MTISNNPEGHMQPYTKRHRHYSGIALHARTMHICIVDHDGNQLISKHIPANPDDFSASTNWLAMPRLTRNTVLDEHLRSLREVSREPQQWSIQHVCRDRLRRV